MVIINAHTAFSFLHWFMITDLLEPCLQTFGFGKDGSVDYVWKCSMIVGGVYFFFITENLMKMYIRFAEWKV